MFANWAPRSLGACVAARVFYADSNAPTLISIGGILIIVFVIWSLDFDQDLSYKLRGMSGS